MFYGGFRIYIRGFGVIWSGRRDSNPRQPAWKAGTLPAELLPHFHSYFSPKNRLCQKGSPCLTKNAATELGVLIEGYTLCARAEGKSPKTISTVTSSVSYLERYLSSEGWPTDARYIGPNEIRAFILYLKNKKRFSQHPYATPQQDSLSDYSINCYVRSVSVLPPITVPLRMCLMRSERVGPVRESLEGEFSTA